MKFYKKQFLKSKNMTIIVTNKTHNIWLINKGFLEEKINFNKNGSFHPKAEVKK